MEVAVLPHRSVLRRAATPVLVGLALAAGTLGARAQTARVSVDRENLRQAPQGKVLAQVNQGTDLAIVGRQGQWRQVVLSGWIWGPSVSSVNRDGFDLVVSAAGGENLRAQPDAGADVDARLLRGFLLEKTGEQGSWVHVRRTAWMWGPSLAGSSTPGGSSGGSPSGGGGSGGAGAGEAGGSAGGARPAAGSNQLPDHVVVKGAPARLFVSPQGDTLAVARPGADLQVLEHRGEWSRVRLEGWVRNSELLPADSAAASAGLTPSDLRTNPDQYVGRVVRWNVQFISLEKAEAVRTDFYEGEPFILARSPGPSESFVYLAVPPELLQQVGALRPLQSIQVVARVRTGRSALMGAPVLNLLEIH
jgi:hypothetical protein